MPAIHLPSSIVRPATPVVPVDRRGERPAAGTPQPPRSQPGAIIDTWACPGTPPATSFAPASLTPARTATAVAMAVPGKLALELPSPETLADPAARLADTLRQAIADSGVFYESHLAEWVEGRRPLSDVLREARSASEATTAPRDAGDAVNPEPLRSQQIDFLRQGELGWTLPAPWPGSALWVSDAPSGPRDAADVVSALVRLDLEIPGRGRLQVSLRLGGQGLLVDLNSPEASNILPDELADLARRLQHRGSPRLAALRVGTAVCTMRTDTGSPDGRDGSSSPDGVGRIG